MLSRCFLGPWGPLLLLLLLLLSWPSSTAVKTPSASASTSLSSSLLNLAANLEGGGGDSGLGGGKGGGGGLGGLGGLGGGRLRIQASSAAGSLLDETPPPREECRVKNLKQHQRMTTAKLDAHRCLLRDTVVELPAPEDVIVDFVQPSHVVVQRCTGEFRK